MRTAFLSFRMVALRGWAVAPASNRAIVFTLTPERLARVRAKKSFTNGAE